MALLGCLAVLVAVLAGMCAWAPSAAGRQEDRALRQRVAAAQAGAPLITLSAVPQVLGSGPPALDMAALLADGRALSHRLGGAAGRYASFARAGSYDYGQAALASPRPPGRASGSTVLALSYLPAAQAHLRYVSGHPPADRTPAGSAPQVALSQATAKALGVRVGSRLGLRYDPVPALQKAPAAGLVVSGVFRAAAGADDFWSSRATLAQPARQPRQGAFGTVLAAGGLVGLDAADRLASAGVPGPSVTWELRPDLRHAALDRAGALTGPLSRYGADLDRELCRGTDEFTGGESCTVGRQHTGPLTVTDALTPLVAAFAAQDHQARGLALFAVDSLAAVALATAAVAVRLLLRRRSAHLRLQRARGASTARLVAARSAVPWAVIALAAGAGWAAGRLPAPAGVSGAPRPLSAVAVAAAAALTVSLLTWLAVREPARPRRSGRARRRAAVGRRTVAEATVLLAAAAGVVALRSQGPDRVLGAVPVLVAAAAVLVLLRVHPLLLRLVLRRARRGRGAVGFVGAARAAHDAPATGPALFVLVLTLGTAVFGGLVQRTVHDGLAAGAAWSAGADAGATVAGNATPPAGTLNGTPGIRVALEHLRTVDLVGEADGADLPSVAVVTVTPAQLASVAPHSPLAGRLRSALAGAPAAGGTRLPAVVSPALRARERTGGFTASVTVRGKPTVQLDLDPAGTLDAADLRDPLLGPVTAHLPPGTPLVITTAAADRVLPQQSSGSTVLLLRGPGGDPAALKAAAFRALGPLAQVRTRAEALSALRGDGLTRGVAAVYTATSALAALFGLLAVALELVLTSHDRGRTTAFLRTLGLGGRGAGALHFLQMLPLAAAAAVGGALVGLLEPRLTAPALDLRQFTGGAVSPALRTDYALTAALVGGVLLLILAAAAAETLLARRRRLGAVLRLD